MKSNIAIFSIIAVLFLSRFSAAQIIEPVKWKYEIKDAKDGFVNIVLKANIEKNWYLYSQNVPPGGPLPTEIVFEKNSNFKTIGKTSESPKPVEKYDDIFKMNIKMWQKEAFFTQKIQIFSAQKFTMDVNLDYMVCDAVSCIPFSDNLSIEIDGSKFYKETGKIIDKLDISDEAKTDVDTDILVEDSTKEVITKDTSADDIVLKDKSATKGSSSWYVFWLGLIGGLLAFFTPCVWPLIPVTVGFFVNRSQSKASAIRDAVFYGISVIIVYVVLGMAVSIVFGADKLNLLATSPVFNLFFFALLVFFAISFFGAFKLALPGKWTTSIDRKAERSGGLLGIFFMGLALVLVSFACTGPIIGALLVEAASSGNYLSPLMGMFGFSVALATPFTILAIFPSWLKSISKSDTGRMNSVKVVLAFLILAFSLKFFVIADSVGGWNILSRDAFIVIWIVIFILLGFYLLGKIKFYHDRDVKRIGMGRLFLAIISFSFAVWMVPGLWGAPLSAISSFLPSITKQNFNITTMQGSSEENFDLKKYGNYNVKEGVYGLVKFMDYDEGMEFAKKQKMPVFLDFSGLGCANCRKMEVTAWRDNRALSMLRNDYVIITLYTDDRTKLPENEQYTSTATGRERKIRTVGQKWADFQASTYGVHSQPYYILLNNDGEMLTTPMAYDSNVENFVGFLEKGLRGYQK